MAVRPQHCTSLDHNIAPHAHNAAPPTAVCRRRARTARSSTPRTARQRPRGRARRTKLSNKSGGAPTTMHRPQHCTTHTKPHDTRTRAAGTPRHQQSTRRTTRKKPHPRRASPYPTMGATLQAVHPCRRGLHWFQERARVPGMRLRENDPPPNEPRDPLDTV